MKKFIPLALLLAAGFLSGCKKEGAAPAPTTPPPAGEPAAPAEPGK